ncbi:MAG: cupin domain-containing protein [Flavipsychrobacter sp.]|nr:cupin domain-containing protein [Flavipsychrobacter sp.]
MEVTQPKAYKASAQTERSRHYLGGYWTFLTTGADTGGAFALIEAHLRKNMEPPRHIHTKEDETYYVLDGEIDFVAGDETHHLKTGDVIFLPKNQPHHFKIQSDTIKLLVHLAPAGLEEMFLELSKPAEVHGMPPAAAGPPPPEFIARVKELQQKYGIVGMNNNEIKSA